MKRNKTRNTWLTIGLILMLLLTTLVVPVFATEGADSGTNGYDVEDFGESDDFYDWDDDEEWDDFYDEDDFYDFEDEFFDHEDEYQDAIPLDNLSIFPGGETPPLFVDFVGLLDMEEADALLAKLEQVSDRYDFDVVVAVVYAKDDRNTHTFAVDFFEDNNYGRGPNRDGCILLLAMEERDFGFASIGRGLEVFTLTGQDYLLGLYLPHLQEGDFAGAFMAYADAVDDFLDKAEQGEPYAKGNIPGTEKDPAKRRSIFSIGGIIISFLASLFTTGRWKGQLKSVREQSGASQYVRPGSLNLLNQRDVFLYKSVKKLPRTSSDSSSSNASTFTSSSGTKSTGHSGKF